MQRAAGRRLFDASKDKWADMKRAYGRCKIFKMHGKRLARLIRPPWFYISIVYRYRHCCQVCERNFIHIFPQISARFLSEYPRDLYQRDIERFFFFFFLRFEKFFPSEQYFYISLYSLYFCKKIRIRSFKICIDFCRSFDCSDRLNFSQNSILHLAN